MLSNRNHRSLKRREDVGGRLPSDKECIEVNKLSVDFGPKKLKKAGFGKVVIDSGAGENVMPWQMLPQEP